MRTEPLGLVSPWRVCQLYLIVGAFGLAAAYEINSNLNTLLFSLAMPTSLELAGLLAAAASILCGVLGAPLAVVAIFGRCVGIYLRDGKVVIATWWWSSYRLDQIVSVKARRYQQMGYKSVALDIVLRDGRKRTFATQAYRTSTEEIADRIRAHVPGLGAAGQATVTQDG